MKKLNNLLSKKIDKMSARKAAIFSISCGLLGLLIIIIPIVTNLVEKIPVIISNLLISLFVILMSANFFFGFVAGVKNGELDNNRYL